MTSCCLVSEVFLFFCFFQIELQTRELQLTFNVGRRLFVGRITKLPPLRYTGRNAWSDSTTSALTYKSSRFEWADLHSQLDWWEKLATLIDMSRSHNTGKQKIHFDGLAFALKLMLWCRCLFSDEAVCLMEMWSGFLLEEQSLWVKLFVISTAA